MYECNGNARCIQALANEYQTDTNALHLVKLDQPRFGNATCADGTPAAIYVRAGTSQAADGTSQAADTVVIYLDGGDQCATRRACARVLALEPRKLGRKRAGPWPAAVHGLTLLDADAARNPALHDASAVYVPYCTQDLWLGGGGRVAVSDDAAEQNTSPATTPLIFDGHGVFARAVARLLAPGGAGGVALGDASTVVLAGSSAGGIGAAANVGYLSHAMSEHHRNRIERNVETQQDSVGPPPLVAGLVDSAWMIDFDPLVPREGDGGHLTEILEDGLRLWRPRFDRPGFAAGCPAWAHASPHLRALCFGTDALAARAREPLLYVNSQYDFFGAMVANQDATLAAAGTDGEDGGSGARPSPDAVVAYIEGYGSAARSSLTAALGGGNNRTMRHSAFLVACARHTWLPGALVPLSSAAGQRHVTSLLGGAVRVTDYGFATETFSTVAVAGPSSPGGGDAYANVAFFELHQDPRAWETLAAPRADGGAATQGGEEEPVTLRDAVGEWLAVERRYHAARTAAGRRLAAAAAGGACPAACASCQSGGGLRGEAVNADGVCEYYCSSGFYCGTGAAYEAGVDCTGCGTAAVGDDACASGYDAVRDRPLVFASDTCRTALCNPTCGAQVLLGASADWNVDDGFGAQFVTDDSRYVRLGAFYVLAVLTLLSAVAVDHAVWHVMTSRASKAFWAQARAAAGTRDGGGSDGSDDLADEFHDADDGEKQKQKEKENGLARPISLELVAVSEAAGHAPVDGTDGSDGTRGARKAAPAGGDGDGGGDDGGGDVGGDNGDGDGGFGVALSCAALRYFAPNGRQILKGVSCVLLPGELCAVMGPSGSGKSTLLDVLTLRRTVGEVSGRRCVNGLNVDGPPPGGAGAADPARREFLREWMTAKLAYVEQQDVFFPELTCREHLAMVAQMSLSQFLPLRRKLERCEEVLAAMQLGACADTRIGDGGRSVQGGLSGGQMRRLSVAAALVRVPGVLVADEPTSGLDSASAMTLMRCLASVARRGVAVAVSIHQPRNEIVEIFDKMIVVYDGELAYAGSPADARAHFAEHFGMPEDADNVPNWALDHLQEITDRGDAKERAGVARCFAGSPLYAKGVGDVLAAERCDERALGDRTFAALERAVKGAAVAGGSHSWGRAVGVWHAARTATARQFLRRRGTSFRATIKTPVECLQSTWLHRKIAVLHTDTYGL